MPPIAARIHVLTGGPYHPVTAQFKEFQADLGPGVEMLFGDGAAAFDHLDQCDLLVLGGLHWTGSAPDRHSWPEGVAPCGYNPPSGAQKSAFTRYVASGRPLLGWHGGIASFDDWPQFGELTGFRWDWKVTAHSRYQEWDVKLQPTGHPVLDGVRDYRLPDELYYNVQLTPGLDYAVHAHAVIPNDGIHFPMIMTGQGGRIEGAGKTAYLANGHDQKSTANPELRKVVRNTIHWLLSK